MEPLTENERAALVVDSDGLGQKALDRIDYLEKALRVVQGNLLSYPMCSQKQRAHDVLRKVMNNEPL